MEPEDGYRILDLDPAASDDEVKRAWRDLTNVWHPDRFGHDPRLQRKAEEKLKTILEAYETVRSSRAGDATRTREGEGEDARGESAPPGESPGAGVERIRRYGLRAAAAAAVAVFVLLRRPTLAGLVVAVVLFGLSGWFFARMRSAEREVSSARNRSAPGESP